MNSDHEIEVTEETPAAAEALETASETVLDHDDAEASDAAEHADDDVESAMLSGDDEDHEDEEDEDEEDGEHDEEAKAEDESDEEGESDEDADEEVAA